MYRNRWFRAALLREARLVAVSTGTVKAWESGRRAPKLATQRQVAARAWAGFEDLEVPESDGGEDLRRLRQARGWTRAEAAERLGVQAVHAAASGGGSGVSAGPAEDDTGLRRWAGRTWGRRRGGAEGAGGEWRFTFALGRVRCNVRIQRS